MVTLASTGVVLVLSVLALPFAFDQAPPGERYEIPENLHVGDDMKEVVGTLLARSQTLRAQCARIAATPRARIVVEVTGNRFGSQARARATARRYDSGLLTVVIELPAMAIADFAELLAHELEHVIELIDNVDLAELMKQRSAGVTRTSDGLYETTRAQAAGKAAAAEALIETDPAAAAIGRGVAKAARLAWRGLQSLIPNP